MHGQEFHLNNFKDDFLNIQMFVHPQIPYFQILSKPYINGNYLFSFQMMHKSQFHKSDPYDWFCAPHIMHVRL